MPPPHLVPSCAIPLGCGLPLTMDALCHVLHKCQEHAGPAFAQSLPASAHADPHVPRPPCPISGNAPNSRPAPAPNRPLHLARRRAELVQNRQRAVDGLDCRRDYHPTTACVSNARKKQDVVTCPPCLNELARARNKEGVDGEGREGKKNSRIICSSELDPPERRIMPSRTA